MPVAKNLLHLILVVSLLLPSFSYAQQNPAQIIEISAEEMKERLSQNPDLRPLIIAQYVSKPVQINAKEEAKKKREEEDSASATSNTGAHFLGDIARASDGRAILIILAVVGAVMTVVWIASVPYYSYLAITGKKKYDFHQEVSLSYSKIVSNSSKKFFERDGEIESIKYKLFFQNENDPKLKSIHVGIAAEVGHYHLSDRDKNLNKSNYLNGEFWLVGPSALLAFEPNFMPLISYKLNLLGGTSFSSDIGIMAKVEMEASVSIFENFKVSPSIAAQYFDINDNKGITSGSNPDILLGISLGYSFF